MEEELALPGQCRAVQQPAAWLPLLLLCAGCCPSALAATASGTLHRCPTLTTRCRPASRCLQYGEQPLGRRGDPLAGCRLSWPCQRSAHACGSPLLSTPVQCCGCLCALPRSWLLVRQHGFQSQHVLALLQTWSSRMLWSGLA